MKLKKILIILLLFCSCNGDNDFQPAEIYYGEDTCVRCKMIISESEFAAQYILSDNGVEKFDDIGCMIHYMNERGKVDKEIAKKYVVDYKTKNWIEADKAYYVKSEDIKTPMGHGIIAFKKEGDARELKGLYIGNFQDARRRIIEEHN